MKKEVRLDPTRKLIGEWLLEFRNTHSIDTWPPGGTEEFLYQCLWGELLETLISGAESFGGEHFGAQLPNSALFPEVDDPDQMTKFLLAAIADGSLQDLINRFKEDIG